MDRDLESFTLPDEPLAPSIPGDDDIEIIDSGEDEPLVLEPKGVERRAQNESPESEEEAEDDGSDPDLADIKDAAAKERVMAARREMATHRREALAREEHLYKQMLETEKRNVVIQRDSHKMALDSIDLKVHQVVQAMKAAEIDDDRGAKIDLEQNLAELRKVRGDIEAMAGQIPTAAELDQKFAKFIHQRREEVGRQAPETGLKPQSQLASKWAAANPWMNSAKHSIESQAVVTLSNQLAGEGYNINSNEHFVELSKRMAKKFPSLPIKDSHGRALSGVAPQKKPNAGPPVASAQSAGLSQSRINGKVKTTVQLDGTDRRMMRVLGMDPSNKSHKDRYAKEKLNRLRSEQRA